MDVHSRNPVTGIVPPGPRFAGQQKAPPGTLFHGTVYKTEPDTSSPLGELRVIYDHVEIPGKGKYPVCVVSAANGITELKDDKATAFSLVTASPYTSWAPPLY